MSDKKCELLEACIFFNDKMSDMPGTAAMYKRQFCLGDNSRCARFMVVKAVGREHVPATLFPNQLKQAEALIAEKRAPRS